jgi:hypothetical protein
VSRAVDPTPAAKRPVGDLHNVLIGRDMVDDRDRHALRMAAACRASTLWPAEQRLTGK